MEGEKGIEVLVYYKSGMIGSARITREPLIPGYNSGILKIVTAHGYVVWERKKAEEGE